MRVSYRLEGLDCADCAAKLERKLNTIAGITSATVNFMTLKCILEAPDEAMPSVTEAALKIIRREEPDVEVKKI